jgi:hypothetical protein
MSPGSTGRERIPSSAPPRIEPSLKYLSLSSFCNTPIIRSPSVVIIFTAAAILTPPDPITQIGLAIPLLILYELSIFSVSLIEKKSKKDDA